MSKNKMDEWGKDFSEFMTIEAVGVPGSLSQDVFAQVHQDLRPAALKVFGKTLFVQLSVGLVTLLFCPQFGVSFTSNMGLMPYLMKFGENICMFGCGALFTGLSLLVAGFLLRPEEVRALRRHEVLQLTSIATLSLGAFVCLGGEVVMTIGLVWLLGSVVGGALTLEGSWALRQFCLHRLVR